MNATTTTTTAPCPHCRAVHDVSARSTGETVWCRFCAGWFRITFTTVGVELSQADPPAQWPKERRKL